MKSETIERIIKLAKDGKSQRDISKELGIPRSTIQYNLSKYEYQPELYYHNGEVQRWVVLPDAHTAPPGDGRGHDTRTDDALRQYLGDHTWDGWLCLGDLCDFDAVSNWNKTKIRHVLGRTVKKQYDVSNKYLDLHQDVIRGNNPDARMVLLEGNHDYWIERYIDEHPQMEGMLEVETGLDLARREIEWVPTWSMGKLFKLGHASFVHGQYINKYHARKMAEAYGTNIFYGHTHDVQLYSYERLGDDATFVGQSLGCLCNYDQNYNRTRGPNKWQQAFGVFYFLPNGMFYYYVIRIFDHSFVSPEGKIYNG